ncbi:MAG: hypothetical protein ACFE0J_15965 [Elainellaceae cyanobacterium]
MKQSPWLSLALLLAAYSTFSWFLHRSTVTWLVWALAAVFALSQALLLTAFSDGFRLIINSWLRSDAGYFTSVVVAAMLVAIAFVWINIFGYILVLVAAEMLARLDLQNAGLNRTQSLAVLTITSFAGLAVGWTASQFL